MIGTMDVCWMCRGAGGVLLAALCPCPRPWEPLLISPWKGEGMECGRGGWLWSEGVLVGVLGVWGGCCCLNWDSWDLVLVVWVASRVVGVFFVASLGAYLGGYG